MKRRGAGVMMATAIAVGLRVAPVAAGAAADRMDELERRIELLGREIERERLGDIYAPVGDRHHGLGPGEER